MTEEQKPEELPEFEPLQTFEFEFPSTQYGTLHAWQMNHPAAMEADGTAPSADASVAAWIVQAPWAHPVWNSYWLHIIHLRQLVAADGEARPEPVIYLEGATHEMWLYALDPALDPEKIARTCKPLGAVLTPINFAAQLKLNNDAAACALLEATAYDVLHARLNPDTDALRQWCQRFGDNMLKRELH